MTKARLLVLLFAVFGGLVLGAAVYYAASLNAVSPSGQGKAAQEEESDDDLFAVTSDPFGGPFTLINQDGKTVTEKDFTGRWRLIYFGFTYCPAICPTELQKITAALNALGDQGKDILPLFITVDPERDTPEKMKAYIRMFHPSLVGLSGSEAQTEQVLKGYKIYAAKVQDPNMSEYTLDHSAYVYLMAPDDRLLHIFKIGDTAEDMIRIISAWRKKEAHSPDVK